MKKLTHKITENRFPVLMLLAYLVLGAVRPQISITGLQNSIYYIKEMLMIMPVIFVMTALLDSWVPKDTILKFLGKRAGIKGLLLSFTLGSISAGPIYAAFPICVMLHKKGASIQNIVIILSSWAVIKIPMLLNEAKFLGLPFMGVRWVLTIIAILIFSWISAKIVKDTDLPQEVAEEPMGVSIHTDACMGCTLCTKKYPALFYMDGKKAAVRTGQLPDMEQLQQTIQACPVHAISYHAAVPQDKDNR